MYRVTVRNKVAPHYEPRNTNTYVHIHNVYIHMYTYICGIRFLFTTHAFSIDLPSSLSLS